MFEEWVMMLIEAHGDISSFYSAAIYASYYFTRRQVGCTTIFGVERCRLYSLYY